jgi:hypothetical protein
VFTKQGITFVCIQIEQTVSKKEKRYEVYSMVETNQMAAVMYRNVRPSHRVVVGRCWYHKDGDGGV